MINHEQKQAEQIKRRKPGEEKRQNKNGHKLQKLKEKQKDHFSFFVCAKNSR